MQSTYRLKASELDGDFIEALKKLYKDRAISITISDEEPMDETEYLMRSEANRKRLLESIKNVREGKAVREVSLDELKKMYEENRI